MLSLRYKTSFPKNPNQSRQLTVLYLIVRYVSVLQDNATFMTSENVDYKMFTMRQKWSVWLSDLAYLKLLCYKK